MASRKYKNVTRKLSDLSDVQFGTQENVPAILKRILSPVDENGYTKRVILVGHQLDCDIKVIKSATGFDFSSLPNVLGCRFSA